MSEQQKIKRGRLVLLALVSIFVIPIFVAWWLLNSVEEEGIWGTTNHGVLLQPPQPLQLFTVNTLDHGQLSLEDVNNIWTMVYIAPDPCNDECRQTVYHMRQIWIGLGREADRLQRVLLVPADADWLQQLPLAEYPHMKIVEDRSQAGSLPGSLQAQFPHPMTAEQTGIYLIDPLGNLMMLFPQGMDPRDILKDIKKLMRISQVG